MLQEKKHEIAPGFFIVPDIFNYYQNLDNNLKMIVTKTLTVLHDKFKEKKFEELIQKGYLYYIGRKSEINLKSYYALRIEQFNLGISFIYIEDKHHFTIQNIIIE